MRNSQKLVKSIFLLILLLWTIPTFATTYEDAEDNAISRWNIYDNNPSGAMISNIYDVDRGSQVIKLNGNGTYNGYMLGSLGGWENPNAWNNTVDKKIKWSMKYSEKYIIYISVQTQNGHRLLSYTNSDSNNGISFGAIHHGLGQSSNNGTWQTFTRDLEADLKEFESDNQITSVDAFLVRGSGYIDDVMSVGDVTPSVDTTKPVITLLGDENVTLAVGDTYTDAGATAMDDMDGNITSSILVTGLPIDTSSEGNYTVTYDVTDSSGNVADVVTRKVIVEATSSDVGGTSFSVKGNSRLLGNYDTSGFAFDVTLSDDGTKAYIADGYFGLKILNISNPSSPTLLSVYDVGDHPFDGLNDPSGGVWDVVLSSDGTKAYIANGYSGLKILDISNPASPTLLGSYNTPGRSVGIVLSSDETKAYIVNDRLESGLQIIDVSNPTSPTLLSSYDTAGYANDIKLSSDGTKAYIAESDLVQIVDISNPTSLTLVGSYDTTGNIYNITLSADGTKAYIADRTSGLQVVDISNPTSPTLLNSYDTSGSAYGVALSADGTKAYVADGDSGLQIIDLTTTNQYKQKDFGDTNIKLQITDNLSRNMTLSVTTDRDDIISVGSYDETLPFDEYNNQDILIPISSISGATGQTIITITLNNGTQTFTRKVYFNVYE